jgi:hypothetical protein
MKLTDYAAGLSAGWASQEKDYVRNTSMSCNTTEILPTL